MEVNVLVLLLYVGLFGLAGLMLSRAWRIGKRNRLDLVCNWSNVQLEQPERYKPIYITINLVGGIALLALAGLVLAVGLPFGTWVSLAALIFWSYFFAYQFLSWNAKKNAHNEAMAAERAKQSKG